MTTPPELAVAEQKRDQRRTGYILLLVALALAVSLGFAYRADRRAELGEGYRVELEYKVATNGQLADEAIKAAQEANRRLDAAGKPTVPVPSAAAVEPPSSEPKPKEDGLSADQYRQVRDLVAGEVAKANAPITQAEVTQIARVAATFVPKPKDGKTPTAAELQPLVDIALATYCGEDRCAGRAGDDGPKGDTGDKGDQGDPGRDAPKVTDAQLRPLIATSLAAYCAQDSKPCDGKVGGQGPKGDPGRGIADTDCIGSGGESFWRILYSDGTTSDESGPCRLATVPTPETPPTAAGR